MTIWLRKINANIEVDDLPYGQLLQGFSFDVDETSCVTAGNYTAIAYKDKIHVWNQKDVPNMFGMSAGTILILN